MHEQEQLGVATAGQDDEVGELVRTMLVGVAESVDAAKEVVAEPVVAEPVGVAPVGAEPEAIEPDGAVPDGIAPEGIADPDGGPPAPPPVPMPEFAFATPPSSVSVAAGETVYDADVSMPIAAHARMPSETESPRRTYSIIGSMSSASSAKMLSSAFNVFCCVFVVYGATASTAVMRASSKKSCPTCEALLPAYVPLARRTPSVWCTSTWMCSVRPV